MAPPERDPNTLRRYLLRTLPPDERDRLEVEALRDPEAFDDLQAAEDDLFHDYARGLLADGEREDFERTLLALPGVEERVAAARALVRALDAQPPAAAAPTWRWTAVLAAAAALAVLAAWLLLRARPAETPLTAAVSPPPSPPPSASPAPPARVLALALAPGAVRSGGTMPTAAVDARTTALELLLTLPAAPPPRMAAVLRTAEGAAVWSAGDLVAEGRLLTLRPPLDALAEADYELVLSRTAGSRPVAEYRFRLLRE